jgi:hypothetical protein
MTEADLDRQRSLSRTSIASETVPGPNPMGYSDERPSTIHRLKDVRVPNLKFAAYSAFGFLTIS